MNTMNLINYLKRNIHEQLFDNWFYKAPCPCYNGSDLIVKHKLFLLIALQKERYIAWVILWRLKRPPQIKIIWAGYNRFFKSW